MEITLNGVQESLPDGATARQLLETLALARQKVALEINGEIVPKSTFGQRLIKAGDRVEIIRAVGGG
ncbi:MAG: sulfur carrier protein ThiS [Gammaproteobacteria bacterium]|nr:sulfur carrier protein ThiS [Gammaproteobacteria bacterium]